MAILKQLVHTSTIRILTNEEITTDLGRTQASINGRFTLPLLDNQFITEDILNVNVARSGGFDPFSQSKVEIFMNGSMIASANWPFGRTEPLNFDIEDVGDKIKITKESDSSAKVNVLEVRVTQSPADGLNRWNVDALLTYNLNTNEVPPEDPKVLPPEKEENKGDGILGDVDFVKIGAGVAIIGGVLLFASGFGKGLGRGVGSR